jgi:hypothetical protein
LKGPSTLALFVAVVGSGLVGMLVCAGLFYTNARRTNPASSEMHSSLFQSREKAEMRQNEWISLGGIYVVETLTMIWRMVPVTALEKKKLKTQNDQAMRLKVETEYSVCLDRVETDLAKKLCSFGPHKVIAANDVVIPQKKTIEDQIVKKLTISVENARMIKSCGLLNVLK